MRDQNFEKFYYTKVATGEGCGCAERIIDVHEFERLAGRPKIVSGRGLSPTRWVRRLLRRGPGETRTDQS